MSALPKGSPSTTAHPSSEALCRQAIRKVTALATLPQIAARIVQIVEDPNSNAQHLKKVISHDPALATRILKIVNSAYYGLPGQVNSVDRAIVMLGFREVKNIAMATNLGALFRGTELQGPYTAKDLWRHCLAVGVAARELAKQSRAMSGRSADAFLAGLIHDLGLLVQLQVNPDRLSKVCAKAFEEIQNGSTTLNFCALERSIIGVDHEQLGQALTENWRFPETYQQVVGFHHHPKLARGDSRDLVGLIHIGDILVCRMNTGFNATARARQWEPADLEKLGLDESKIEKVLSDLPTQIDEAAVIFD
ncbi:MAG: HDOD domain-containing protein [Tepidisphaeraceae bacterium]|jgi:HD-like signal output (HDOD) protein